MSRRTYDFTAAARLDLLEIWIYLADHASLEVADEIASEIEDNCRQIGKYPLRGHRRTDLTPRNLRFWRVASYLVVYRLDSKPVRIVRILHAARNVKKLLKE